MPADHLTANATKDHLVAARMATLLHEAKSSNAMAFREEVLELLYDSRARVAQASGRRYRRPQAKELPTQRQTLDALLADLLRASEHAEALGYCYRSSNRQEFTDGASRASWRAYDWQVSALDTLGLIHRVMGYAANDDFDGDKVVNYRRATRMRATPSLMAIAQRNGIQPDNLYEDYTKPLKEAPNLVVLRSKATKYGSMKTLKCPDTDKTAVIRSAVQRINAIYSRHSFDLLPQPQVYRLFNSADVDGFDFNKGGRLYGDFQNISRAKRKHALIEGKPVAELDIKGSHLTILHGVTNTPMPMGDPYYIDGLPRPVVKALVTRMMGLGHTNLVRWSEESRKHLLIELGDGQSLDARTFNKLYPIKVTAQKVVERHPVLNQLCPDQLDWADLQFLESQVLISAILRLGEEYDIPALPVHDSIIVPIDAAELGRTCLAEAFEKITGQVPMIEMK